MAYLLIALVLCLILSSLVWIKPSPRQKLLAAMRREATAQGLQVQLSKAPDAREGEGRLDHAIYLLPWGPDTAAQSTGEWLLIKGSRRGVEASWEGWRWLSREAPITWHQTIGEALRKLPDDVDGLSASPRGLGVFWRERGGLEDVGWIAEILRQLRSQSTLYPKTP